MTHILKKFIIFCTTPNGTICGLFAIMEIFYTNLKNTYNSVKNFVIFFQKHQKNVFSSFWRFLSLQLFFYIRDNCRLFLYPPSFFTKHRKNVFSILNILTHILKKFVIFCTTPQQHSMWFIHNHEDFRHEFLKHI